MVVTPIWKKAKAFFLIEVGNTPLLEVDGVYAKLECTNPLGSIKDRMAKYIIEQSEKLGLLRHGMTIVEASSGNTGIALSYYARQKGYPIIIVMPRNMTDERKRILERLGAKLILCSAGNFVEAASIRDRISQKPWYFNPDQFSNPLRARMIAIFRRLHDFAISFTSGPEKMGMRPGALAMMRQDSAQYTKVYDLLNERTGLRIPDLEQLLQALDADKSD